MSIIAIVALVYVGLCLVFYFGQDYFFFRPEVLPRNFEYKYPFPFKEVDFEMEDGGVINGIHFEVPNSKGVVYYLKGNSRSIKGWGKFARDFVSKGYDFFMVDYRGFGKSKGRRTETTLYNDAQTVYRWLADRYPEDKIVIYGRSLGSGIAARIASWNRPRMIILDSPYFSFWKQVHRYGFWLPLRWLLRYKMRVDQFLKTVNCPIFLFHGDRDRLIHYRFSKMLKKLYPNKIKLFTIPDGKHNNLPTFAEYHEWLYDILNDEVLYEELKAELTDRAMVA
jgi:alpha-beta hydrolase superfamily lysophospholipase